MRWQKEIAEKLSLAGINLSNVKSHNVKSHKVKSRGSCLNKTLQTLDFTDSNIKNICIQITKVILIHFSMK
jgi:hypothetical protein